MDGVVALRLVDGQTINAPPPVKTTICSAVRPRGKNYAGAYHQPAAVFADPSVLATLPPEELAAGWADYADGHEEQQRVGVVHAAANGAMIAGYAASLAARLRGRSTRGALLGWAALAAGVVGANLGGHMAYH